MARTQSQECAQKTLDNAEAALEAANDAARNARNLFFGFMAVTAYVAVIIASTTHEQILRETPVTLPLLNVELPLSGFYRYLPWLYLLLHFNLLLTLALMAGKVRMVLGYRPALLPVGEWQSLVTRLIGFPVAQVLAGEQERFMHGLLVLVIWITLVLVPLGILLWLLIGYLPAQDESVLAWQRVALSLDAVGLLLLWPRLISGERTATWWGANLRGVGAFLVWLVLFLWFDLTYVLIRRVQTGHWVSTPSLRRYAGGAQHYLTVMYRLRKHRWALRRRVPAPSPNTRPTGLLRRLVRFRRHYVEATVLLGGAVLVTGIAWFAAVIPGSTWEARLLMSCERDYRRSLVEDACRWWPTWVLFDWEHRDAKSGEVQDRAWFQRTLNVREAALSGEPMTPVQVAAFRENDPAAIEQAMKSLVPFNPGDRWLRYANLGDTLLPKADLRKAQIQGADLGWANLRGAFLPQAALQGANLAGADLQGADLVGADLGGARLGGIQLKGANLGRVKLQGAYLAGADLREATINDARVHGADLQWADLRGASLSGAQLQGADLRGAQLQGADLRGADLQGAMINQADLRGARLGGVNLRGATLFQADLQGADLRSAQLQGANLANARLSYAVMLKAHIGAFTRQDYNALELRLTPSLRGNAQLERTLGHLADLAMAQESTQLQDVLVEPAETCLVDGKLAEELPKCRSGESWWGRYLADTIPFWVGLACSETWVARRLVDRTLDAAREASSIPQARASVHQALRQLAECDGFRPFSAEYADRLESIVETLEAPPERAD